MHVGRLWQCIRIGAPGGMPFGFLPWLCACHREKRRYQNRSTWLYAPGLMLVSVRRGSIERYQEEVSELAHLA